MSDRVIVLPSDRSESRLLTLRTVATELAQALAALERIDERLERVSTLAANEQELGPLAEVVTRLRATLRASERYSLRDAIREVNTLMRTIDEPLQQVPTSA